MGKIEIEGCKSQQLQLFLWRCDVIPKLKEKFTYKNPEMRTDGQKYRSEL